MKTQINPTRASLEVCFAAGMYQFAMNFVSLRVVLVVTMLEYTSNYAAPFNYPNSLQESHQTIMYNQTGE